MIIHRKLSNMKFSRPLYKKTIETVQEISAIRHMGLKGLKPENLAK